MTVTGVQSGLKFTCVFRKHRLLFVNNHSVLMNLELGHRRGLPSCLSSTLFGHSLKTTGARERYACLRVMLHM